MTQLRTPLPVDSILPRILASLQSSPNLVLQASPGSGKTTRVPAAVLRSSWVSLDQEILVLEPRRLAAELAARRVADELGSEVGGEVGFQFRFENRTSARTRLRFLTEGMLMRRLIQDPDLKKVNTLFLDEFHERHLHGDVAISYLRSLQLHRRPDLRIVVMSATLDAEPISRFLGQCPIIQIEAPIYPLEISYLKHSPARTLELEVKKAVTEALELQKEGDILVFLPGMADIRRAQSALSGDRYSVKILHGELSREEQDEALSVSKERKVILSTNVAESSVTLPSVRTVIDGGLHKMARYSWWSGVPSLKTRPVSRASATQRAGRAARLGPGLCLRLYTKGDFDSRPAFETPEIQRADLSQTVLELASLGFSNREKFSWFDSPPITSIQASELLLYRLGALTAEGSITALGREMNSIPAHPRLARLLLESMKQGCKREAIALAALVSEGDLESLDAFSQLDHATQDSRYRRIRSQLESIRSLQAASTLKGELGRAVLAGFPDRVVKKRKTSHGLELLFATGGSAPIEDSAFLQKSDYFIVLDAQESQGVNQTRAQVQIKSLCSIQEDWLFDLENSLLEDRQEVVWNTDRKRVDLVSRMKFGQIILAESLKAEGLENSPAESELIRSLLLKMAFGLDLTQVRDLSLQECISIFPKTGSISTLEMLVARVGMIAQHFPKSGLVPLTVPVMVEKILSALDGKRSLADLEGFEAGFELFNLYGSEEQRLIRQYAPDSFQLPNGRRVNINYSLDQAPWIESRLQDFFGVKENPSVCGGRIPLVLHLLAPNMRALQVTQDLPGFWRRTYAEVRKEQMRRYPRHAWPEDPSRAEPVPSKPRRGEKL